MLGLTQNSHFRLWDIIPPHGGIMFIKKNSISYMINTKSDHFSPPTQRKSRSFMEIGNQIQNHKIGTNSELNIKVEAFDRL